MKTAVPRLIFSQAGFDAVVGDLVSTPDLERAAVGFAGLVTTPAGTPRLLVRDWLPVPADEYLVQLGYHLEVSPVFLARAAKRAGRTGEALIIMHSHPREPATPEFSASDDFGEDRLVPKIQARAAVPVAALVVGPRGHSARLHPFRGTLRTLDVSVLGAPPVYHDTPAADERFQRQVLALGSEGQARLAKVHAAVVGAGGTGSHVVQQLLHLGVGKVTVVDPDHLQETNLSRLVGTKLSDLKGPTAKVEIMRRLARTLGRQRHLAAIRDTIVDEPAARRMLDCDVIFGCTDSQWARYVLNAMAYQFYVPVVDMGVELQASGTMGGRVSWLTPDTGCLWCRGVLNAEAIRVEQMPAPERSAQAKRGYIPDADVPVPAVISVNGAVASLAVTEFLARWTGFAGTGRRASELAYRLSDGTVRRCEVHARATCPTCGPDGPLGAGSLAPPPWRQRSV